MCSAAGWLVRGQCTVLCSFYGFLFGNLLSFSSFHTHNPIKSLLITTFLVCYSFPMWHFYSHHTGRICDLSLPCSITSQFFSFDNSCLEQATEEFCHYLLAIHPNSLFPKGSARSRAQGQPHPSPETKENLCRQVGVIIILILMSDFPVLESVITTCINLFSAPRGISLTCRPCWSMYRACLRMVRVSCYHGTELEGDRGRKGRSKTRRPAWFLTLCGSSASAACSGSSVSNWGEEFLGAFLAVPPMVTVSGRWLVLLGTRTPITTVSSQYLWRLWLCWGFFVAFHTLTWLFQPDNEVVTLFLSFFCLLCLAYLYPNFYFYTFWIILFKYVFFYSMEQHFYL